MYFNLFLSSILLKMSSRISKKYHTKEPIFLLNAPMNIIKKIQKLKNQFFTKQTVLDFSQKTKLIDSNNPHLDLLNINFVKEKLKFRIKNFSSLQKYALICINYIEKEVIGTSLNEISLQQNQLIDKNNIKKIVPRDPIPVIPEIAAPVSHGLEMAPTNNLSIPVDQQQVPEINPFMEENTLVKNNRKIDNSRFLSPLEFYHSGVIRAITLELLHVSFYFSEELKTLQGNTFKQDEKIWLLILNSMSSLIKEIMLLRSTCIKNKSFPQLSKYSLLTKTPFFHNLYQSVKLTLEKDFNYIQKPDEIAELFTTKDIYAAAMFVCRLEQSLDFEDFNLHFYLYFNFFLKEYYIKRAYTKNSTINTQKIFNDIQKPLLNYLDKCLLETQTNDILQCFYYLNNNDSFIKHIFQLVDNKNIIGLNLCEYFFNEKHLILLAEFVAPRSFYIDFFAYKLKDLNIEKLEDKILLDPTHGILLLIYYYLPSLSIIGDTLNTYKDPLTYFCAQLSHYLDIALQPNSLTKAAESIPPLKYINKITLLFRNKTLDNLLEPLYKENIVMIQPKVAFGNPEYEANITLQYISPKYLKFIEEINIIIKKQNLFLKQLNLCYLLFNCSLEELSESHRDLLFVYFHILKCKYLLDYKHNDFDSEDKAIIYFECYKDPLEGFGFLLYYTCSSNFNIVQNFNHLKTVILRLKKWFTILVDNSYSEDFRSQIITDKTFKIIDKFILEPNIALECDIDALKNVLVQFIPQFNKQNALIFHQTPTDKEKLNSVIETITIGSWMLTYCKRKENLQITENAYKRAFAHYILFNEPQKQFLDYKESFLKSKKCQRNLIKMLYPLLFESGTDTFIKLKYAQKIVILNLIKHFIPLRNPIIYGLLFDDISGGILLLLSVLGDSLFIIKKLFRYFFHFKKVYKFKHFKE